MNTAAQLHGASLSVLQDLERAVKAHVTPERVICFLGPWIRRAEFEAVVSKGAIQATFIPNAVVEALADWRMGQAVVWAMEAMRAQGLDVDVVVRTDEVRIRWTKD